MSKFEKGAATFLAWTAAQFIGGLCVQWVFNVLFAGYCSLPEVTYWQAFGLYYLLTLSAPSAVTG